MGIFLTLFYIATAYLTPTAVFGDVAQYHLQIVIALFALLFSLLSLPGSGLLRLPQTYALVALAAAVACSLVANGWVGGAPIALLDFLPNAVVFFLIVLNFRTKTHFQILVGLLFLVAAYIIYQGFAAERIEDVTNPFVLLMLNGEGVKFYRIRGLGFLNDPNDFSQFLAALIPCMFLFWRAGRWFTSTLLVFPLVAVLLYGMFLTHSRGGMMALLAAAIVLGRRKIGVLPSLAIGAALFAGLSAVGWSGGRDVSADAGADRMEAWSAGLDLIRTHRLFGVGYSRFSEFFPITAHNTVVVCAAEVGLIGFFFWTMIIVSTMRNLAVTGTAIADAHPQPQQDEPSRFPFRVESAFKARNTAMLLHPAPALAFSGSGGGTTQAQTPSFAVEPRPGPESIGFDLTPAPSISIADLRRMAQIMMVAMTGFLAAGWFLSRAYTMVLFVNLGLAAAVYRIAREKGLVPPPLSAFKAIKLAALWSVALLIAVYILVRVDHLLPKG